MYSLQGGLNSELTTTAYVTIALLESGFDNKVIIKVFSWNSKTVSLACLEYLIFTVEIRLSTTLFYVTQLCLFSRFDGSNLPHLGIRLPLANVFRSSSPTCKDFKWFPRVMKNYSFLLQVGLVLHVLRILAIYYI